MKKIATIKAYKASTYTFEVGDEIQVNSSNTITALRHYPTIRRVFGESDVMTIQLESASSWAVAEALSFRTRLLVTYDDTSKEVWRINEIRAKHGTSSTYVIEARSIWTDLGSKLLRYVLEPSFRAVHRLQLTGVEFTDALTTIFDVDYGMISFFAKGSVATSLASTKITLNANASTFLDLIKNLVDQVGCEVEYRYDAGTLYFDFVEIAGLSDAEIANSYTPDPSSRPIHSPTGGGGTSQGNRISLTVEDAQDDFYTRIVPFAGTEEIQVGINSIAWTVSSVTTVSGTTKEATLSGDPIYVDDLYVGGAFIDNLGRTFVISDSIAPNKIRYNGSGLTPDPSTVEFLHIEGTAVLASEGTSLSYLNLPAVEASKGIVEKTVFFPDIVPYDNLFVEAGGSGDMSSGVTSGDYLPDGIVKVGSPTTTEETAALYVNHGTSSLKVEADSGEGVQTDEITLATTSEEKYFSFWIGIRVTSGKVRASIVDAEGITHPVGVDKLDFGSDALLAIQSGGNAINPGDARLKIIALEDNTTFYIDAITLTRSVGPYEFAQNMGKKALYRQAGELLVATGGEINPSYRLDLYDITAYDDSISFAETKVGSYVEIKDNWNGSSFAIDIDARVMEIIEDEDPIHGRLRKRIRVERRRPQFVDRVIASGVPPKTEAAPPAVEDQYQTTTTSQSYWLGQSYTAGEVLTGFTSPLRAAASLMSIPGAYLLHTGTISTDGTNYVTFTLYNETQDVALGSFTTETADLTTLTATALTMTSEAQAVEANDVLSVRVSGAGTGVALNQCVIILEVGGKYIPPTGPEPDTLYFSDDANRVRKASIARGTTGWPVTTLFTAAKSIRALRVDQAGGKIYTLEADYTLGESYVRTRDLDGSNPQTLITLSGTQYYLAVGRKIEKVFLNTDDYVYRYDFAGTLEATLAMTSFYTVAGAVNIDENNEYLHFITSGGGNKYFHKFDVSSNSDTELDDLDSLMTSGVAKDIEIDAAEGYCFINDSNEDKVRRIPSPDGGSLSTIISGATEHAIGIDRFNKELYSSDFNASIFVSDYDATTLTKVIDESVAGNNIEHICLGY